jgi:hypothetical protein
MYGKLYPARIRSLYLGQKHAKDEEDQTFALVVLQYDLTEELAAAIGGAAPQIQAMLAQSGDGCKVSRAGFILDVAEVAMQFKGADKDELKIPRTLRLKAKGRSPNAEDTGPTLEVGAAFAIDDDAPLAFFRAHLGELVKVRLDKKQLDLPIEPTE